MVVSVLCESKAALNDQLAEMDTGGIPVRRPRAWLYLLFLGAAFCLGAQPASAFPVLQLYAENSHYVGESWLTYDNPYTLQVVGTRQNPFANEITEVNLIISLPPLYNGKTYANADLIEWVTIQGVEGNSSLSTDNNPANHTGLSMSLAPGDSYWHEGNPDYPGPGVFPPHGVFPCPFWQVPLPDLQVGSAGEDVYDFGEEFDPADPGDTKAGDIQYYEIEYSPYHPEVLLHVDVYGATDWPSKYWFAPFSHDADAAHTPEPATLGLLLAGLAGLAFVKKRRG